MVIRQVVASLLVRSWVIVEGAGCGYQAGRRFAPRRFAPPLVASLLPGITPSTLLSSLRSPQLNLQVVGWIFSHEGGETTRSGDDDNEKIPVKASQVRTATKLQAANMKRFGRSPGSKFVTLSVSKVGEAEAFQMSDVAVQMNSDGVFDRADAESGPRFLKTNDPVSVGGKETKEVRGDE